MKTQTRGICQCCGREQAVLNGTGFMSQHGYTVKNGWCHSGDIATGRDLDLADWEYLGSVPHAPDHF